MVSLTEKQLQCLRDAAVGPISPWNYGSTTISALKKLGLVDKLVNNVSTAYVANEAGRAFLYGGSK